MTVDDSLERRIDEFIRDDSEKLVEDIFSVVSIKSVSQKGQDGYPFGKGCHDVLEKALLIAGNYGFRTKNCDNHCGYVEYGENKGEKLGMFAHLDVVPEGDGWQTPPYSPVMRDGFLIGRGVADNKGAAMYCLHALRFLKENGIRLKHNVLLYFGCSEETGMEDIEYFTSHEQVPYFSIVPDSDFPVCYGEKGILRFNVKGKLQEDGNIVSMKAGLVVNSIPAYAEAELGTLDSGLAGRLAGIEGITVSGTKVSAQGVASHAAFPEGSKNAIHVLSSALLQTGAASKNEELISLFEQVSSCYDGKTLGVDMSDPQSGPLTVVATVLRTAKGYATLSFDMRYPVTASGDGIIHMLEKTFAQKNVEFSVDSNSSPAYTPIDSPEVRTLCRIAEHVHARKLTPYTMGGGTYSRKLPFAVGFGPGLPDAPNLFPAGRGNGHQSDECISFELLKKGMKATIMALIELDDLIS